MKEKKPFLKRAAPASRYYFLVSIAYALVSIGLTLAGLVYEIDDFGLGFLGLLVVLALVAAIWNFLKSRRVHEEAVVIMQTQIPDYYSDPELLAYYRRIVVWATPAFLIASIWTGYDLLRLESGRSTSGFLMAPIFYVYEKLGFWSAALPVPLLGVVVISVLVKKVRDLEKSIGEAVAPVVAE